MLMHLQYFFLNDESVEKHRALAWAEIRKSGFASFGAHAAGWRGPLTALGLPPLYTVSRVTSWRVASSRRVLLTAFGECV